MKSLTPTVTQRDLPVERNAIPSEYFKNSEKLGARTAAVAAGG
jgi:hypothetical protein